MRVRPATTADARLLFAWRNDALTRESSFTSEPVAWADHTAWLDCVIADPSRALYVADDDIGPFGTVRLDLDPPPPVISITVAPERRGEGLAGGLIAVVAELHGPPIVALIKPGNARSISAFEHVGFRRIGSQDGSLRLVWERRVGD